MNRNESGRIVLEGALLLPLVMIIVMSILLLSVGSGLQALLFVKSDEAAMRAAYVWDNSHRNPVSGDFYPGHYDGLYWRITDDYGGSKLTGTKLQETLLLYTGVPDRHGDYRRQLWQSTVRTTMQSPFRMPGWAVVGGKATGVGAASEAVVTDTAEWLRNVRLVQQYWPLVADAITPEEGERIVDQFRQRADSEPEALAFNNHTEAKTYLRQLVRGRETWMATERYKDRRTIEALDANRVAHQAYIGTIVLDSDKLLQMNKDVELAERGLVKGVVWHFFRRRSNGDIGPTPELRRALEERGIVVVVHE